MRFEELQDKLSLVIKRIAYKLNGRYRTFSHDDLFQEALMHLWVDFMAGKLSDKTDSYILQGCYFHLKNYIRKVNEKPDLSLDEMISYEPEGVEFEDIRKSLSNRLLTETIQNNGFDSREKSILAFLKDGLTTRDIGKRIGVSHVMVVKLISKMREKCRKYID